MVTKQVMPIDLDSVPEVDHLLFNLGLGTMVRETVTSPIGRNDAWIGVTTGGRKVFVKRLKGQQEETGRRMRRLLDFERYAANSEFQESWLPQLVGSDESNRIVVFERIDDAINGATLMVDETFSLEHARQVGAAIGRLHATVPPAELELDATTPAFPPLHFLEGLPLSVFHGCSAGEIEAWRLLQNDPEVITAVKRLREAEETAPRVPSHCDLRVDQFLIGEGGLFITDWEEFRLADPARDVGAFAGEWIFRSMLDLVTNRGDEAFVDTEFTHELVLQRGVEKMRRLLPLVGAFWEAYRDARPDLNDDPGLAVRATAFAAYLSGKVLFISGMVAFAWVMVLAVGAVLVDDLTLTEPGRWLTLAWLLPLGLLALLPLGAVIGSLVESPRSIGLVMLPVFALAAISGIFYPVAGFPDWLQLVAQASPLYWLGLGARSALLPDSALAAEIGDSWRHWETFSALGIWAVIGLVAALIVLRLAARRESGSTMTVRRDRALSRQTV